MNMSPVVVTQLCNLFQLAMLAEVERLSNFEANTIVVSDLVNFLLVIHNVDRLRAVLFHIVMNVLAVGLESNDPAPRQLPDCLLGEFIRLRRMEF